MLMKQIIEAYEVLDSSYVTGEAVKKYLQGIKEDADIEVYELVGPKGSTDMLKVRIPGKNGKAKGGDAPTIGLLGRLEESEPVLKESVLYLMETEHSVQWHLQQNFWICRIKETILTEMCLFPLIFVRMLLQHLMIRFHLWDLL